MKLLIAGDSYALFSTPEHPNYDKLAEPKCVEGVSYGELLSTKLNIPVESSAIAGAANPMTVIKALKHILQSHQTDQPITHCIFHYTQSSRISSNSAGLELALKTNNVSYEDYYKHCSDVFFDVADSNFTLDKIISEQLNECDFAAANLATTDSEKFFQHLKDIPIAKIVSDNFAYMALLESCCRKLNIKLIVFSMFVTTKQLFSKDTNLFNLEYATRFEPRRTWSYYSKIQCKTYNIDRTQLLLLRPGNHLYFDEHNELVEDLLEQHPNFFR